MILILEQILHLAILICQFNFTCNTQKSRSGFNSLKLLRAMAIKFKTCVSYAKVNPHLKTSPKSGCVFVEDYDSGPSLNNYLPLTLVVSQPSYIDAYALCQGKN